MTLNRRMLCGALAALTSASPWIARADAPPPPPPMSTEWSGEKDGVTVHLLVYDGEVSVFRWRNTRCHLKQPAFAQRPRLHLQLSRRPRRR